jgi:hypothetical protein
MRCTAPSPRACTCPKESMPAALAPDQGQSLERNSDQGQSLERNSDSKLRCGACVVLDESTCPPPPTLAHADRTASKSCEQRSQTLSHNSQSNSQSNFHSRNRGKFHDSCFLFESRFVLSQSIERESRIESNTCGVCRGRRVVIFLAVSFPCDR